MYELLVTIHILTAPGYEVEQQVQVGLFDTLRDCAFRANAIQNRSKQGFEGLADLGLAIYFQEADCRPIDPSKIGFYFKD